MNCTVLISFTLSASAAASSGPGCGVARARVIAEGAGALALAAAVTGRVEGARRIVCIVSGGNIDVGVLTRILKKETA